MTTKDNNKLVPTGADNSQNLDLTLKARRLTNKALRVLTKIMEDANAPASARVAAAKEVLVRGHGQAPAKLNLVRQFTEEELEMMARELLNKRESEAKLGPVIDATIEEASAPDGD